MSNPTKGRLSRAMQSVVGREDLSESSGADSGGGVGLELLHPDAVLRRRLFYQSIGELMRRYRLLSPGAEEGERLRREPLTGYELKVWSQNGEDGILAEILRRTGTGTRWFVEFGAGDGSEGTCFALADLLGWSGLVIEADAALYDRLDRRFAGHRNVASVRDVVGEANVLDLFEAADVPGDLDVLAIDIDGTDYWVWRALETYTPRIVVVEYNASLGDAPLTVPPDLTTAWDGTDYFGASIGAYEQLGAARGYRLVHTDLSGTNAFFVRDDLAAFMPGREHVVVHPANYMLSGFGHRRDPQAREFVTPPDPRAR